MSIDHVGVFVSDLAATRRFCEEALGLEWVEDDEDEGASITTLRAGGSEVHLFRDKRDARRRGIDHVSIRVPLDFLEERRRALVARGVPVRGPERYKDTVFIKLDDQDGTTWELLATATPAADVQAALIDAVRTCNAAWLRGAPAECAAFFAPDVVLVLPGFAGRLTGRDAAVQSLVDYCAAVRTLSFEETDWQVDLFDDVAVVSYRFGVRYALEGRTHDEAGRELLVFRRAGGRWQAVWRAQLAG